MAKQPNKKPAAPQAEPQRRLHVENGPLIAAIEAVKQDNSNENRSKLVSAICAPDVWFLLPVNEQKQVRLLTAPDGKRFFPAYTSPAQAQSYEQPIAQQEKSLLSVINLPAFAQMIEKDETLSGIIIDPKGVGYVLPREAVLRLRDQREKQEKMAKMPVTVRFPTKLFTSEMTMRLSQMLYKEYPQVSSCYIGSVERGEGEETLRSHLFLLVCEGDDFKDIAKAVCDFCRPFLEKDGRIEVINQKHELGQKIMDESIPFYDRVKAANSTVSVKMFKKAVVNDMTKALNKELYKIKEVDSCFLGVSERNDGENILRSYLFVLEYYGEDLQEMVNLITNTCKPFFPENTRIEVMDYNSDLGREVTQEAEPFFRRQMLWV